MSHYPKIPSELATQLKAIEPIVLAGVAYFPCSVRTRDGAVFDSVYVVEAKGYYAHWGLWPEDDPDKCAIDLNAVVSIEPSQRRLPAHFAKIIHEAGETGMGYHAFTIQFLGGKTQDYVVGGAVDFLDLPEDLQPSDIQCVLPHRNRAPNEYRSTLRYWWCLYSS